MDPGCCGLRCPRDAIADAEKQTAQSPGRPLRPESLIQPQLRATRWGVWGSLELLSSASMLQSLFLGLSHESAHL